MRALQLAERRKAPATMHQLLDGVRLLEYRATLAPYCQAAGPLGALIGATQPAPSSRAYHPAWERRAETLRELYRARSRTVVKETWVAASLGWDPRHVEEGYAVRFALSHEASLVILDGPPDAGLGEAEQRLREGGYRTATGPIFTHQHGDLCARACTLLVAWKGDSHWGQALLEGLSRKRMPKPLPLGSVLLPRDAVPPELFIQEGEGEIKWGGFPIIERCFGQRQPMASTKVVSRRCLTSASNPNG